jgi:cytidine deaminase
MDSFQSYNSLDDLDTESKYLIHKAKEAAQHAYAPYSKFYVGAALLLDDSSVVIGSNQENASYPLCMCAERVALYSLGNTFPEKKISKLAVVAHKKNHKELTIAAPCGACRQVLVEYEQRQKTKMEILFLADQQKWLKYSSAASLLPFSFSADSLIH